MNQDAATRPAKPHATITVVGTEFTRGLRGLTRTRRSRDAPDEIVAISGSSPDRIDLKTRRAAFAINGALAIAGATAFRAPLESLKVLARGLRKKQSVQICVAPGSFTMTIDEVEFRVADPAIDFEDAEAAEPPASGSSADSLPNDPPRDFAKEFAEAGIFGSPTHADAYRRMRGHNDGVPLVEEELERRTSQVRTFLKKVVPGFENLGISRDELLAYLDSRTGVRREGPS